MKKRIPHIFTMIVALLLLTSVNSYAQNSATEGLSIKASPGILSFFGDMSTEDYNPFKVLQNGSKFGFTASLIKQFNPWLAIQARYGMGNLYSVKTEPVTAQTFMSGSLTEFGLAARFDPLPLFLSSSEPMRLSPYVSVGVATIGYRAVRRDVATNNVILPAPGYKPDGVTVNPRQNALAIPLGFGVSYRLFPSISIEFDYGMRVTNTDLLDALVGNTNVNDFYSLATLGIRYHISPISTTRSSRSSASRSSRTRVPVNRTSQKKTDDISRSDLALTNVFIESQMPENISTGNIYEVWLRINKGDYKGPGKLVQKFPDGFTAMQQNATLANFSFNNQNAVIEWDQMPADSVISYTYHVRVGESVAGSQTISGRFEYEQPDGLKVNRFNNYVFVENKLEDQMDQRVMQILGGDEVSDPLRTVTEEDLKEDDYNRKIDEILGEYGTEDRRTQAAADADIKTYQPIQGVEFKIQIGAFRDRSQGGARLARKYGITEPMSEEVSNGWYKYTVGSFRSYEEAVRFRNSFIARTNLLSAFIVAYKNGQRLARVSDALK